MPLGTVPQAGFRLNAAGLRSGKDIRTFELHLPLKTIIAQKCPLSPRNQLFSFPMLNQAGQQFKVLC
jgi:hypothetical protein